MSRKPDLVVSGINRGWNLGEDLLYSGTVAAAFEAAVLGIPAFSISQKDQSDEESQKAAAFAKRVAQRILKEPLSEGSFLNINVPTGEIKGVKVTRIGRRIYPKVTVEKTDPYGRIYYWLAGEPEWREGTDTDFIAVSNGFVSITPVKVDLTHAEKIKEIEDWAEPLKMV